MLTSALERSLTRRGFAVRVVRTGAAGLQEIASNAPTFEVALVDLSLPDGRGEQWIERYLAVSPQLSVVAMSGSPAAVSQPGVSFLPKPFSPGELEQVLTGFRG